MTTNKQSNPRCDSLEGAIVDNELSTKGVTVLAVQNNPRRES
jgi:hypothetical protein